MEALEPAIPQPGLLRQSTVILSEVHAINHELFPRGHASRIYITGTKELEIADKNLIDSVILH